MANCWYTGQARFGIDPASGEFLSGDVCDSDFKDSSSESDRLSAAELSSFYREMTRNYPIVLLEDSFGQDEWDAWTDFTSKAQIELVGDDLLGTNEHRIKIAMDRKACNASSSPITANLSCVSEIQFWLLCIDVDL